MYKEAGILIVFILCINLIHGGFLLRNGCYIHDEKAGTGYKCERNRDGFVIPCERDNLMASRRGFSCGSDSGATKDETFCYPYGTLASRPHNTSKPMCGPAPGTCDREGLFVATSPYANPCNNYFSCTFIKQTYDFKLTLNTCKPGYRFSPTKKQCIIQSCNVNLARPKPLNVERLRTLCKKYDTEFRDGTTNVSPDLIYFPSSKTFEKFVYDMLVKEPKLRFGASIDNIKSCDDVVSEISARPNFIYNFNIGTLIKGGIIDESKPQKEDIIVYELIQMTYKPRQ